MLNLPKWVQRVLEESVCPGCKIKVNKDGVFAEGIRVEVHPTTKKPYLSFFFLYECNKCKKIGTFSGLPTNMQDFISDMIEVANSPNPTDAGELDISSLNESGLSETNEDTGISAKELKDFKKMLKSTKYYEDFLGNIGAKRPDIEKKD